MKILPEAVPSHGSDRERQVRRLFSEIAPRYDLLNHLLSLNVDRRWRRQAISALGWESCPQGSFLDACAGTFDLSLELCSREGFDGQVVASDFAAPMLRAGRPKLGELYIRPVCGDSLRLPFVDQTFHGAVVGFGMRNLADLDLGLGELFRVLRPGATVVILDFAVPSNALIRAGYMLYFDRVLPKLGRWISGHPWAYTYLPESVKEFPSPAGLAERLTSAGFRGVGWRQLTLGIAALHWGRRPA